MKLANLNRLQFRKSILVCIHQLADIPNFRFLHQIQRSSVIFNSHNKLEVIGAQSPIHIFQSEKVEGIARIKTRNNCFNGISEFDGYLQTHPQHSPTVLEFPEGLNEAGFDVGVNRQRVQQSLIQPAVFSGGVVQFLSEFFCPKNQFIDRTLSVLQLRLEFGDLFDEGFVFGSEMVEINFQSLGRCYFGLGLV